jgi:hypothetical protein
VQGMGYVEQMTRQERFQSTPTLTSPAAHITLY